MFQDPVASLSPRMRVGALLAEPFAIHRVKSVDRPREVGRLLDLVGLPASFAGRYPHELSGGQARRVGVARALALSPRLVIADEPTAGLDVSVQGGVLNLLARLQDELGLAYLLITHNLPVVRHVAHAVAVMYMGRLVERGATAAVMARPAHPYTAALLASQPAPDPLRRQAFAGLEGEVPSLRRRPVRAASSAPAAPTRRRAAPPTRRCCARSSRAGRSAATSRWGEDFADFDSTAALRAANLRSPGTRGRQEPCSASSRSTAAASSPAPPPVRS